MNHYIMVMRDTRYWIAGPFESQAKACEWGNSNLYTDPRWQTIQLDHAGMPPVVMLPDAAREYAEAGETE